MKSSLLRRFALHKGDVAEKKEYKLSVHLDELDQASKDIQAMRYCYDSLLSAAAATANSAYEFSESLRDMGTCLLEKTAINDDEESCKELSMLGNVQFELQKLVDCYRSDVILTITTPSESLLNELRTVEEMKRQCDGKRNLYEYMATHQQEKGKSKNGKVEVFTSQQLQAARDEYDNEASLCVFRLKSLKQGQCRSLLTQAARHHAAQLSFFRKGLKFLEAVEPHIRLVTEKQHIDYQLSGLDEGDVDQDEGVNSHKTNHDGELSFDYRLDKQGCDAVSMSRNSMELDQVNIPHLVVETVENAEVLLNEGLQEQTFNWHPRTVSHSAPIFAEKFDRAERVREMQKSSTRKFDSYVLPTPVDVKISISARTNSSVPQSRLTDHGGSTHSLWHSSPLEPEKQEKVCIDDKLSVPTTSKAQSKLKETRTNKLQLPPSLAQGLSLPECATHDTLRRQAFSGPVTGKQFSTKSAFSASGPIASAEIPQLVSGLLYQVSTSQPPSSSPKVSSCVSPPIVSSPKINELHELPRPPGGIASRPVCSSSGHSAPLVFRNRELSPRNKSPAGPFSAVSQLPTPPLIVPRSFSIPSSNQRAMALHMAKQSESPKLPEKTGEVDSSPLTPISLSNIKLLSTVPK